MSSFRINPHIYGKAVEVATEMIRTGETIRPFLTDEKRGALWVSSDPNLLFFPAYFELNGKLFFVGRKKR